MMRFIVKLFVAVVLLFSVTQIAENTVQAEGKSSLSKASYFSLTGGALIHGNLIEGDGMIHQVQVPLLHWFRTSHQLVQGTVLLFPGGDYHLLKATREGEMAAHFLNAEGFDVVILEYRIATDLQVRNLALADALQAFELLKNNAGFKELRSERFDVMGIGSGGHLAARMVQKLDASKQPDHLMLISPSYFDETLVVTVFPVVMPPLDPKSELFVSFATSENKNWSYRAQEYSKIWIGYDGQAEFHELKDSVTADFSWFNNLSSLPEVLKTYLHSKPTTITELPNPATVPVEGYNKKRHAEKVELVANHCYDLIMMGNSITNNFEKPQYQPIWNQFFAPRNAINLGFSAYRTENLIWNIQHGQLEGQSPRVLVLEIGTNNIDEKNYPTRHTAGQLAGGIETIVTLLCEKLPDTKIIIMRCFPGCYGGPNPTSHRAILERASDRVSKLADGKHIFYCDVNHVFLNLDGSLNHAMMGDWLHPTPAGAKAWAQAMEPLLSELMGDQSLDTEIPYNTAIVPKSKLENDSYNWWDRHADVLRIKDSINPEIVMIGNSITHFWGGEPLLRYNNGTLRNPNGPKAWDSAFGNHRVLNMGFGWDRTQNVLWRLDHGELDALHPKTVIIHIGTNNTSQTENARSNTASEVVEGIQAICMRVRSKVPGARIVLMAVFPREEHATHSRRILIQEINQKLETFAQENHIRLIDIGPQMVTSDGTLTREIAGDFCHPTEKGYQIWADAIHELVNEP